MTTLSVNINKIATLRNARGENRPNVLQVALDCEGFGADGITVHPRPDARHITHDDVFALKPALHTEFNIEGNPTPEFMDLVLKVRPTQVTLVPDAPGALTSSAGWDVVENFDFLTDIVDRLHMADIRTSIFIAADCDQVTSAARTGTDRIELYTKPFADQFPSNPDAAVGPFVDASVRAHKLGIGVNAGHDLNLDNLAFFHERVPFLNEVSIGHALICDALYLGLQETIARYRAALGR